MTWLAEARGAAVAPVAAELGHELRRGRSLSPCPACGAADRSERTGDRRGPVGITPDGCGWRCHRCNAGGDAVDLVAWRLGGARLGDLARGRQGDVRAWLASRGLCAALDGAPAPQPKPLPAVQPAPPRERPPAGEVSEVWALARTVVDDAEAAAWCRGRHLDPAAIADRDLLRAIPEGARLPRWCRYRSARLQGWWSTTGHRVVARMFGPGGEALSLHARSVDPACDPADKAAAPAGCTLKGLVLADAAGVELLAHRPGPPVAWIAEGEPDFATLATWWSDADPDAPAVLGVVAGSWDATTPELASCIPEGARVVLATDPDNDGEKYAAKIAATLTDRAELQRWRPLDEV